MRHHQQGDKSLTINEQIAAPTLTEEQIDRLRSYGQVRTVDAGQVLFREGDPTCDFFVILEDLFVLIGPNLEPAVAASAVSKQPGHMPSLFKTSLLGVFAVGDVRSGSIERVASAVGEGSIVVRFIHDYLSLGLASGMARTLP